MLPLSISCVVLPSETINVVLIPAISDAIDALVAVKAPDTAVLSALPLVNVPTLAKLVATSLATLALKAVDDPDITESVTSIEIALVLTVVVIGPEPPIVSVSPLSKAFDVPESPAIVNVVLILAISDAILALKAVEEPLMSVPI